MPKLMVTGLELAKGVNSVEMLETRYEKTYGVRPLRLAKCLEHFNAIDHWSGLGCQIHDGKLLCHSGCTFATEARFNLRTLYRLFIKKEVQYSAKNLHDLSHENLRLRMESLAELLRLS